jgi:lipoyl(octanoyl) transferase
VPCGIDDKAVTSLNTELGRPVDMQEVKARLLKRLSEVFGFETATEP